MERKKLLRLRELLKKELQDLQNLEIPDWAKPRPGEYPYSEMLKTLRKWRRAATKEADRDA